LREKKKDEDEEEEEEEKAGGEDDADVGGEAVAAEARARDQLRRFARFLALSISQGSRGSSTSSCGL